VGFSEAIRICLTRKYADSSGRAGRAEYWWFALFQALVSIVLYAVLLAAAFSEVTWMAIGVGIVWLCVLLALIVPGLAVGVRRLHDLGNEGMSGWFMLFGLLPFGSLALLVMFVMETGPDNKYGPGTGPRFLGNASAAYAVPAPAVAPGDPGWGVTPPASGPPAGWFIDPSEPGQQRYWDGASWTDHTHRPGA